MKKIFIAALLATTLSATASTWRETTDAEKVSYRIKQSFTMDFSDAKEVEWKVTDSYTKAKFTSQGRKAEAFYNYAGKLMATSLDIDFGNLPNTAKKAFAKKYPGYSVKETIHFEGVNEQAYYISAENDKETVVLKVANGTMSIFKREAK